MKKILVNLLLIPTLLLTTVKLAVATTQHPHHYEQETAASQEILNPSVVIRLAEVREWVMKKFPQYYDPYNPDSRIRWKTMNTGWHMRIRKGGRFGDEMFIHLSWDGILEISKNGERVFEGTWYPKFTPLQ